MMKVFFYIFLLLIFAIAINTSSIAYAINNADKPNEIFLHGNLDHTLQNINLNFTLNSGYRIDQLDWSIAGNLGNDYRNVLSELIWKDLEIFQIQFSNRTIIKDSIHFRANVTEGWIHSGSNKDTDYNGNDRTNPWSQTQNTSDDGSVLDFSFGLGYLFKFFNSRIHLTPLIGFSHHRQYLSITDGYQTISEPIWDKQIFPAPLGPFSGLNSSYKTNWLGPWLGADIAYNLTTSAQLIFTIEYHWVDYDAEANWNLIERFEHPVSFEHNASGNGIILKANWCSHLRHNWHLNLELGYQSWQTASGVDRTYFSDGSIVETHLNKVTWESSSVGLGIAYQF
ncbi:MAG: hypothetical protein PVI90_10385 [Desulfobacteraceae bacterium]|jgi:hypothetical protein